MDDSGSMGKDFRLLEIRSIRDKLQSEIGKRARCRRRYKRMNSTTYVINVGGCILGSAATTGAITTLLTVAGIVIAVPLGAVALTSAIVSLVGASLQKNFYKKIQKHDRLLMLAKMKLTTINVLISRALDDNGISDTEFNYIECVVADYYIKKQAIQTKIRNEVDDEIKLMKNQLTISK